MTRTRVHPLILSAVFMAILLGPPVARAFTVKTDFYTSVDLARFETWAWRAGTPAKNRQIEDHLRAQIEARLAAKGYIKTDRGEADFYVVAHAMKDPVFFFAFLRIDIFEAQSGQLVMSGQASDVTPETLKSAKKVANKAVAKILKSFPKSGG